MEITNALLDALGKTLPSCGCSSPQGYGTSVSIKSRYPGRVDPGTTISVDREVRIDLRNYVIDNEGTARALRDLEAVKEILDGNRESALQLVKAVQAGDIDSAVRVAAGMGLTEEALLARGGGLSFLVVFAVAVVLVLVTPTPTSIEADPPAQPSYPLTVDGDTMSDIDNYLGQ